MFSTADDSNDQINLGASTDFIIYLLLTGFFVLTCSIADQRRRQRELEQAEEQLRRQVAENRRCGAHGQTAAAAEADPEKRKQDILNALILRTVTVLDVTKSSEEEENDEEKGASTNEQQHDLKSNLKKLRAGGRCKRSLLMIWRRTVSASALSRVSPSVEQMQPLAIDISTRSAPQSQWQPAIGGSSSRPSLREVPSVNLPVDDDDGNTNTNNSSMLQQSRNFETNSNNDQGGSNPVSAATCPCEYMPADCDHTSSTRSSSAKERGMSVMPLVDEESPEDEEAAATEKSTATDTTTIMGMLLIEDEWAAVDHIEDGSCGEGGCGRLTDATCSICLLGYEEGDSIAWSRNPRCKHAFHEECIVPWLMKHDECPNCRNDYFVFEDTHNKQKVSNSGSDVITRHGHGSMGEEDEYGGLSSEEQV